MKSMNLMWWADLHQNNTIQLKRWFGDTKDYTEDCQDNPFVLKVMPPIEAETREQALKLGQQFLN